MPHWCALVLALSGCDAGDDTGGDAGDSRPPVDDTQRSCPDPTAIGCGIVRVSGSLEPCGMGHVGDPALPTCSQGMSTSRAISTWTRTR